MIDWAGWASLALQLFEKMIPSLGKVKFIVDDVMMQLDIPRKKDAEGGYEHGSYGSFTLEIINKKNKIPTCTVFIKKP